MRERPTRGEEERIKSAQARSPCTLSGALGIRRKASQALLCQFVLNEIASREGHSRCTYTGVLHLQVLPQSHLVLLHVDRLPSQAQRSPRGLVVATQRLSLPHHLCRFAVFYSYKSKHSLPDEPREHSLESRTTNALEVHLGGTSGATWTKRPGAGEEIEPSSRQRIDSAGSP